MFLAKSVYKDFGILLLSPKQNPNKRHFTTNSCMNAEVIAKQEKKVVKLPKTEPLKLDQERHKPDICERCGEQMVQVHCTMMCNNCGFSKDCNDQW
jgi:hypothetical protein